MGDPSEGAELTPTSGAVCLARLRTVTRPQPLSMGTLQAARDALERCGELGEELGSCLDLALERFCQEPRCVQENARLLIPWGGGELEFVSGQGQCEVSVSCSAGEPQYHITEKTCDVFVAWMKSHPEPLSIKNLQRIRNTPASWGASGEVLSGCFGEAISQFGREAPSVQENARLRLCWDRGSLEFLSGRGHYEISVSYQEGNRHYHFHVETLPVHLYVARLRSLMDPLSADSLINVYTELGLCQGDSAMLRSCLNTAWQGFSQEPRCVQENARLLIRWDVGELEFVSGQGQCEISVLYVDGEPQYHITALGGDRPVTWSHTSPELLSIANLARVRDRLRHWGELGEELSGCFGEAISQFSREPRCVQGNARMLIRCGKRQLQFTSGKGECEITVRYEASGPQYHVRKIPVPLYVAQLRAHQQPLSADTLQRVLRELGSCLGDTDALRACFDRAWEGFSREPRCVQENARLLIRWDEGELEFVSGQGQCEISVLLADGEPQYHITELGGDRPVTWSHTSPELLSVADLERVWDRLGRWGELGEELSGCFGEAISQFSREPPWVQGNARMRLCWDRGSLEFLSGRGQYIFSVSYQEGNRRYHFHVETHPVHLYVTRLRSCKDPLSADSLFKFHTELGLCRGDTAVLRACLYTAWRGFRREPRCVQENVRLLIRWGGGGAGVRLWAGGEFNQCV